MHRFLVVAIGKLTDPKTCATDLTTFTHQNIVMSQFKLLAFARMGQIYPGFLRQP